MKSKLHLLDKFKKWPSFTTQDAHQEGVSPRMLSFYVKKGYLFRHAHGLYCMASHEMRGKDAQWEDLAVAAHRIKGGVICLISALAYYEMTDEFMRAFWIAVDRHNSKVKYPRARLVRMSDLQLGVQEIKLAGLPVKIFDIERTIVDAFRFLSFETAMQALKLYVKGEKGRPDFNKICRYAKKLRAAKVIDYIRILSV